MRARKPRRQAGFTYFMLLWWVALSGVMLAALAQNWRFERQREREAEMVARAEEIANAIAAYHQRVIGGQPGIWPATLQDLVEDKRGPAVVRHLRRVWVDPLTRKPDWGLVRDGPGANDAAQRPRDAARAASSALGSGASQPATSPFGASPFTDSPLQAAGPGGAVPAAPAAASSEGGIRGVFSRAAGRPIRAPTGIHTYAEWRFEAGPATSGP